MTPASRLSAKPARALLARMFRAAVRSGREFPDIARLFPEAPPNRTALLVVGKAAAPMGRALVSARAARGHRRARNLAIVPRGSPGPRGMEIVEAAHPVPDATSVRAGKMALDLARSLGKGDLLVAAFSGGGSSLLCAPAAGLSLRDKRETNRALLDSGLDIREMNCIRAQLSEIKGGRLGLAARPAGIATFVASDVPGDDPSLVASGPTAGPPSSAAEALEIVRRSGIRLPAAALRLMRDRAARELPCARRGRSRRGAVHVVASPGRALERAIGVAEDAGVLAVNLGVCPSGDAETVARAHAKMAREWRCESRRPTGSAILASGGEANVKVSRRGRGGRNTTYLLRLALEMDGAGDFQALAADTDGIDGTESNAGAFCDGSTAARLRQLGANPERLLRENRAYDAFEMLGDLLVTGPTGANVNDFRAIFVS